MKLKTLIRKFCSEKLPAIVAWFEMDEGPNIQMRQQEWASFLIEQHRSLIPLPKFLKTAKVSKTNLKNYISEMVKDGLMEADNYPEFL